METVETRPVPKINPKNQIKSSIDSVKKHLKDDDLLFSIFETIPEKIFPCNFKKTDKDYRRKISFIVEFGDVNTIRQLEDRYMKMVFSNVSKRIYKTKIPLTPQIGFKWVMHDNWENKKKVYRIAIGNCEKRDSEIIQIFLCKEDEYKTLIEDFSGLRFVNEKK
jgi:hypothetical protein